MEEAAFRGLRKLDREGSNVSAGVKQQRQLENPAATDNRV